MDIDIIFMFMVIMKDGVKILEIIMRSKNVIVVVIMILFIMTLNLGIENNLIIFLYISL